MFLAGKTALVTGAAKRVGRAIAVSLARAGADLALHYGRSADEAAELAEVIGDETGRRAKICQADLGQPLEIERLFAAVGAEFGKLDVLVNNAAVYHRTPFESLTAEQWDAEMAINARAPALCIHHALPLMPDGSSIVNITDARTETTRADWPAYSASKAALLAVTKSAAKALAGRNIRVNAVGPGAIMWEPDISEQSKAAVLAQVPMKRIGSPDDIAEAVVFLIRNDYITGQHLRVDGGWHTG
ncbi:MAG: SDR family NAD(P)-dependent oxidoreductase [Planctomycetota bacterium]|jgi:pteridine reductase